jgi:hypothetical protein
MTKAGVNINPSISTTDKSLATFERFRFISLSSFLGFGLVSC